MINAVKIIAWLRWKKDWLLFPLGRDEGWAERVGAVDIDIHVYEDLNIDEGLPCVINADTDERLPCVVDSATDEGLPCVVDSDTDEGLPCVIDSATDERLPCVVDSVTDEDLPGIVNTSLHSEDWIEVEERNGARLGGVGGGSWTPVDQNSGPSHNEHNNNWTR